MAPAVSRFKLSFWLLLVLFALAWALSAGLAVALGAIAIPANELVRVLLGGANPADPALAGLATIVWQVRAPRVLLGGLCGLGLAVSGVAWQGVLRNPLADPYLIGASAGGALGAAAAILFGIGGNQPYAVPVLAFAGSLGAVALVYRLAHQTGRGLAIDRLVLAGVAVSAFLSACLSLAMLAHSESFTRLYFWLIGGFSGLGWSQVALLAPYVGLSLVGIAYFTPRLNLLQMGEETAHGLGVHVERDRRWVIALASLLTAAVVSVCGMIGFVGLVVPHVARLLVGPDLRRVLPAAALLGGALLTLADLAARVLWAPQEIPVGVLTAMLGAPFFLYLLRRRA